jgi:hypothetical protein
MPFPLAHPAAVLPLRRFCPRYLSFPALIIGSLSPDLGYFSGPFRLDGFSHRFLAGSFGFCLPTGLLLLLAFYLVRSRVVGILPARYRPLLSPLCQRPMGSPVAIVVSLLLGAWTHLVLDAITRPDPGLAQHLSILQSFTPAVGKYRFRVCEVLYAGCTFSGVAWLAYYYLRWLERTAGAPISTARGVKSGCSVLLGVSILGIAMAGRGGNRSVGLISVGIFAAGVVLLFLAATSVATTPRVSR